MDYEVVPANSVRLKAIAKTEAWLEGELKKKPSLLGPEFADVEFLDAQRSTPGGGRLDLLLYDEETDRRFVVELMLGRLDESHLVRAIEYWDIERRRYPAYEHVAVIAAEDIETRFLNVIALMAGNIPLIALKLNAFTLENKLVLQFTKVLDLRELRRDDIAESSGAGTDRATWVKKTTPEILAQIDSLVRFLQQQVPGLELSYLVHYLGIKIDGVSNNFVIFKPKKKWFYVFLYYLVDREAWLEKFKGAGLEVKFHRDRAIRVRFLPSELAGHRELLEQALKETATQ